jgi:hypothetical protein
MHIRYGIDDFVATSRLTLSLYKAFKNVLKELLEISRESYSFDIVIADLMNQADGELSI